VPAGYDVLATGVPDGNGRWRAEAVRDMAATIGHFEVASAVVDAPAPVEVTVGVDRGVAEPPQVYLDRVVAALVEFATRFGPYPWPALTVAITPGLRGGVEMPMHIMQGPGTVGRTTPHEVAHMWFYSLVGNNQARDPWLDEGLASYAEATHEDTLDEFRATTQGAAASGSLGEDLTYWADAGGGYYEGVYQQGAVAMADLGEEWLVDCALRHYVADHAYGIADPTDLLAALEPLIPTAPSALAVHGIPAE
jgi:aminopeptidase N